MKSPNHGLYNHAPVPSPHAVLSPAHEPETPEPGPPQNSGIKKPLESESDEDAQPERSTANVDGETRKWLSGQVKF